MEDAFEIQWEVVFDGSRTHSLMAIQCRLVGTFNPNDAAGPVVSQVWADVAGANKPAVFVDLLAQDADADLHFLGLAIKANAFRDEGLRQALGGDDWHSKADATGYVGEMKRAAA